MTKIQRVQFPVRKVSEGRDYKFIAEEVYQRFPKVMKALEEAEREEQKEGEALGKSTKHD